MKLKSLAAVGACAALVLCGCEKTEESSAVQSEYFTTTVTDSSPTPVEVRTYEFPEFLNGEKTGDMLANVVSGGFDPEAAAVKAEESPSEEHKAVQCLLGEYYTFLDSGYIGIMNSGGNVIIKPEKYNSVKAVSNELLALGYIDEDGDKTDYYQVRGGYCKPVAAGFRQEDIEVTEIPPENEQASAQYCLSVRGAAATDAYDSI